MCAYGCLARSDLLAAFRLVIGAGLIDLLETLLVRARDLSGLVHAVALADEPPVGVLEPCADCVCNHLLELLLDEARPERPHRLVQQVVL